MDIVAERPPLDLNSIRARVIAGEATQRDALDLLAEVQRRPTIEDVKAYLRRADKEALEAFK